MSPLEGLIQQISGAGVDRLRAIWLTELNEEPPPVRAGDVLRRALAERLQEQALGSDAELQRRIHKLAVRHKPGTKPVASRPTYQSGSLLVRVWEGVRHEVEILPGGYRWRGQTFDSLSAIARQITGTRWNGPRFFGLREEKR